MIYCLDVETYLDTDGDGVGDFAGLIRQIDYLAGLGVTCLWLMPFYPSPGRDDGYDISDYFGVDSRLGSLGDFVDLVRTANDRGIKVIVDLVLNHTSDEHPWFAEARASRGLSPALVLHLARRALRRAQGHRLPRQGDEQLGARQDHGPVLPAPLLPLSARPQRCQSRGARRDRQDRRLLAAAGRGRLPDGRRALHARARRDRRAGRRRSSRMAAQPARLRVAAKRRHGAAGRGEHRPEGSGPLLRRRGRRPAQHAVRLSTQPEPLALARARERRAARIHDQQPARPAARQRLGHVPAQPRRAQPRQAHRTSARGGLRGVRARRGHAALRAWAAPAGGVDAGRRRPAPADGLEPDALAARHAGDLHGRRDRDGREPGHPRPHERARADAVVGRRQRRVLHSPGEGRRSPAHRRRLRTQEGQRRRPAARARLAAQLDGAPDPSPQGEPGVRLGHQRADRDRGAGAVRPPLRVAGLHGRGGTQPLAQGDQLHPRAGDARGGEGGDRRPAGGARPQAGTRTAPSTSSSRPTATCG